MSNNRTLNKDAPSWSPKSNTQSLDTKGSNSKNWRSQTGRPAQRKWSNNNNSNNNSKKISPNKEVPVGTFPADVPTSGPLYDFLQLPEVPCFDSNLLESFKSFDDDFHLMEKWVFWLEPMRKEGGDGAQSREEYLQSLKQSRPLDSYRRVKDFAIQACDNPNNAKVLLFKQGVKPVWEDRANYNGGRFFISNSSKTLATNTFLTVVLKALSNQLLSSNELCGFAITLHGSNKFAVQVWNKNSAEKDQIRICRKVMKKLFKKNVNYHVHRTSLKINKFGLQAVNSEIEKAEADKQAAKLAAQKVEAKKLADAVAVDIVEAPKTTIIDTTAKAVVTVALSTAWDSAVDAQN